MPLRKEGEPGKSSCREHLAWARALPAVEMFLSSAGWLVASGRRDFMRSFTDPGRGGSEHLKAQVYGLMVQRLPDLLQPGRCSSDEKRGKVLGPTLGWVAEITSPRATGPGCRKAGWCEVGGTFLTTHHSDCTSQEPDPESRRPILEPGGPNLLFSEAASGVLAPLLPQRLPSCSLEDSPSTACAPSRAHLLSHLGPPPGFPPSGRRQLLKSLFVERLLRIQKCFLP